MVRPQVPHHLRGRAPHVELGHPVLEGIDRDNEEDGARLGTAEEHVHERDHLDGLAQPHAVGQDTAEARAVVEPAEGLDQIVVQETHTTNLQHRKTTLRVQKTPKNYNQGSVATTDTFWVITLISLKCLARYEILSHVKI